MIIASDTETTGLDPEHGCMPFIVSFCDSKQNQVWYEWDVDPLTRIPNVSEEDVEEIQTRYYESQTIVFQNCLFDSRFLKSIGVYLPWDKVRDTLRGGHILDSTSNKDLTTMASVYLGIQIGHLDETVNSYTIKARRIAKSKLPEWRIAKEGDPMLPSGAGVKADMWLLRAIVKHAPELLPDVEKEKRGELIPIWSQGDNPQSHPWNNAVIEYANMDTAATMAVYLKQIKLIKERGYLEHYEKLHELYPIADKMTEVGVTVSKKVLQDSVNKFKRESVKLKLRCEKIARSYGYDFKLPKGGNNNALVEFAFNGLKLPKVVKTRTGQGSLNKEAMNIYKDTLDRSSDAYVFIDSLSNKRRRDTAVGYMEAYERFWERVRPNWYRLYTTFNVTKTVTLRWSSSNPNTQNISKQDDFNCRVPFGPLPGRKWASLDYDNLELRIPAYECEEPAMLELFEHPDKPPYYGSYHLLIFSILHPDKYDHDDPEGLIKARDKYKSTWYQWTKNGNFAELYGAVDTKDGKSTADRAFHMPGAQEIVAKRLKEKSKLNDKWIRYAERKGFVETMPDLEVNPKHGYPLHCPKNYWGKILKTVPLNYHVQGTAMWVIMMAMIEVNRYLKTLKDWHMVLQVHDELVIDFPDNCNYKPKLRTVRRLMESIGNRIGVPLTCGCTIHDTTWAKGYDL